MVKELPLFPGAPRKSTRRFSLWRVKPLEEWTVPQFYGYFTWQLEQKGRALSNSQDAALSMLKKLLDAFEKNLGARGKEALRDFIDQCLLDPRCTGVGFLLRHAESFLTAQAWRYRDDGKEEEF